MIPYQSNPPDTTQCCYAFPIWLYFSNISIVHVMKPQSPLLSYTAMCLIKLLPPASLFPLLIEKCKMRILESF